jgi:tetratricopeptide (TPR) repeat protein
MNRFVPHVGWCLFLALACSLTARAQEKYKDFDAAFNDAARRVRDGDYPAAIAPLEAALKLAKDDAQRMKAYQALVPAYQLLPQIDKLLAAQEFIIRHTDRRAGRSLAARDVVSAAFQRGKTDAIAERYEAQLKENPKDPAALTILTVVFTQTKRSDPRGPELKTQLDDLDLELAQKLAERLEKDAESAPRTSAAYLKDAATAWLEAGDKAKALAAAKKSAAGPPEQRTSILTYQWHSGLGDVFLQTGEPQLAIAQLEAALAATDQPALRKSVEKKMAEARGAAGK